MIIDQHKVIFIHIPKNAGTSIETFFENSSFRIQPNKHDTAHEIKRKFPNAYNSYSKLAIIRNPYDRMVSWYFYLERQALKHVKDYGRSINNYNIIEFKKWIDEPLQFWYDPIHYLDPQHTWLDETVKIIKFENLNEELNKFFGEKIDLPIINKTNHKHYLNYYNKRSLNIVYNRYKEDFKKYNYKKL